MRDKDCRDLTVAFYDAALGRVTWTDALKQFATAFEAPTAFVFSTAAGSTTTQFIGIWGADREAQIAYAAYYGARNPLIVGRDRLHRSGVVRTSEMICSGRELLASEYYNDFMRPYDYRHSLGVTPIREDGLTVHLGAYRSARAGPFRRDAIRMLARLYAHAERALQIYDRVGPVPDYGVALQQVLDRHVSAGIAFFDRNGRVLYANDALEEIGNVRDGLMLSRDGLRCESRRSADLLGSAMADALAGRSARIAIERPSGSAPYSVLVAPVLTAPRLPGTRRAAVLAMVADPDAAVDSDLIYLRQAFGLTPSEATLAIMLAQSAALDDIAAQRGVSRHTVRTQLKRCLGKMRAARQSDLVRLVLASRLRP